MFTAVVSLTANLLYLFKKKTKTPYILGINWLNYQSNRKIYSVTNSFIYLFAIFLRISRSLKRPAGYTYICTYVYNGVLPFRFYYIHVQKKVNIHLFHINDNFHTFFYCILFPLVHSTFNNERTPKANK